MLDLDPFWISGGSGCIEHIGDPLPQQFCGRGRQQLRFSGIARHFSAIGIIRQMDDRNPELFKQRLCLFILLFQAAEDCLRPRICQNIFQPFRWKIRIKGKIGRAGQQDPDDRDDEFKAPVSHDGDKPFLSEAEPCGKPGGCFPERPVA